MTFDAVMDGEVVEVQKIKNMHEVIVLQPMIVIFINKFFYTMQVWTLKKSSKMFGCCCTRKYGNCVF